MNRRGTEPYARWCGRSAGETPPPTRSRCSAQGNRCLPLLCFDAGSQDMTSCNPLTCLLPTGLFEQTGGQSVQSVRVSSVESPRAQEFAVSNQAIGEYPDALSAYGCPDRGNQWVMRPLGCGIGTDHRVAPFYSMRYDISWYLHSRTPHTA